MKTFTVVMAHTEASDILGRHLPFYRANAGGQPILIFCPSDSTVQVSGCEHLFYGRKQHHGSLANDRFRYLIRHLKERCVGFDRVVIHESDSLCVSKDFPETLKLALYANAFFNRDQNPAFRERLFTHPPLAIPVSLLEKLSAALDSLPIDSSLGFWDRDCGLACDIAGIEIVSFCEHTGQGYSQNTIEVGHLDGLLKAVLRGARVFHGVKEKGVLSMITQCSPWVLHTQFELMKKRFISFSLYGEDPKYFVGMIRNIELAPKIYPGWRVVIYMPESMCGSKWHLELADKYVKAGVVDVKFGPKDIPPMMARLLVVDSPDCELAIIRDADSRLSEREAAAVEEWLISGRLAHSIADHPAHARNFNGGLCGFRKRAVHSMETLIRKYLQNDAGAYGGTDHDQQFLCTRVWSEVKDSVLRHDSHDAKHYPGSMPFPTKRDGWRFCGEVIEVSEDGTETPRARDWPMLMDVREG